MLLKTSIEVKQLLPRLLAKMNNNAFLPNFDRAEQKYLVPLTGADLYQQYVDLYNANNATGFHIQVLKNMQLLVATHAFLDELGTNTATITDAGIQSQQTANSPRVYGWEFKEFKSALQDAAADSVDLLLQALWLNKAGLPAWTACNAFKQFNALLIKTAAAFDQCHRLFQPQRTFYAIKSVIQDCQEQMILQTIGDGLVTYFLQTSDLDDKETKCLGYLQKSLAFYSIKRACEHYAVRMSDNGFTVVSSGDAENSDTAGRSGTRDGFLQMKMAACERDGKGYLSKAKKELAALYASADARDGFKTAYGAGPLADYDPAKIRDLGNANRRTFRT
jgi:hypothetical protein